jgi:hypothetical protein
LKKQKQKQKSFVAKGSTMLPPFPDANVTNLDVTNYDDVVPKWIVQVTDYVIKWGFLLTFGLGLPGNMMSLLITLKRDNRKISTCIYMAALALVDSVVIVNVALLKMLITYGWARELKSSKPFLR